jgi:transposase
MSVRRRRRQSSFYDASFLVEGLFPPENRYRLFRERIHPVMERARAKLEALYCATNGRPGIDPVYLAEVTTLQFMENLPDRQAAMNVELHLGWKYGLGMRVDEQGCDASTLCVFRERLAQAGLADVVFKEVFHELETAGLAKRRRQRIDSTHVLGHVADMSRLECVRETARRWLLAMEKAAPGEGRPEVWKAWEERCCHLSVDGPRQTREQLQKPLRQAGADIQAMRAWLDGEGKARREEAPSLLLRRVFGEQYEITPEGPRERKVTSSGTVVNPHEPQAEWAAKDHGKKTAWIGYKAHVGETAPEEGVTVAPVAPTEQFLTHIETPGAIASDLQGCAEFVEAQLQADPDALRTAYADSAYVSGETLAQAEAQGRELIGPPHPAPGDAEHSAEAFDVNVAERTAVCPAGKRSSHCSRIDDAYQGRVHYRFEWGAQCDACERRRACTKSRAGRRTLCVGEHHDLIQARRRAVDTPEFRRRMRTRAAMEGTISELTRLGLRRSRYRGLAKTRLANYFIGAACNIRRYVRLLAWRLAHPAGALEAAVVGTSG